jgi:hypothetical protein
VERCASNWTETRLMTNHPPPYPFLPLSTNMAPSPDAPSPGLTFPRPEHPASIDLPIPASLRETLDPSDQGRRKHHSLHHRPHLHLRHGHRRSIDSTVSDPLASVPITTKQSPRPRIDTELLGVPKTWEPHARRIDSSSDAPGDRNAPSGDVEPRDGARGEEEDVVSGKGYESPLTPEPVDIPAADADVPALQPKSRDVPRDGQFQSVWDEVRYEHDVKPGITPTYVSAQSPIPPAPNTQMMRRYLSPLLTHLQSLTRAHALKLSTATRTIEHRVAEWTILSDKLDDIDREAGEIGAALVGTTEWARRTGELHTPDREGDEESPTKVLAALVQATARSEESLRALANAVDARADDVHHLREKVEADSVVLERRMGRGLERKMVSIERAQRDTKRRDRTFSPPLPVRYLTNARTRKKWSSTSSRSPRSSSSGSSSPDCCSSTRSCSRLCGGGL